MTYDTALHARTIGEHRLRLVRHVERDVELLDELAQLRVVSRKNRTPPERRPGAFWICRTHGRGGSERAYCRIA